MNPISTRIHPTIRLGILLPAAFLLQVMSLQAATIYQTVEDSDNSSPNWNDELWGTPAAAP
nr:hypothetical protein [Kiritimatiellia bacterium]